MKIFPIKPGTVPCLKTNRIGVDNYKTQIEPGSLGAVLQRTRDERHATATEARKRQADGNPMAEEWIEESPEVGGYYDKVQGDSEYLAETRKNRKP
jgi:hypothetical protein